MQNIFLDTNLLILFILWIFSVLELFFTNKKNKICSLIIRILLILHIALFFTPFWYISILLIGLNLAYNNYFMNIINFNYLNYVLILFFLRTFTIILLISGYYK